MRHSCGCTSFRPCDRARILFKNRCGEALLTHLNRTMMFTVAAEKAKRPANDSYSTAAYPEAWRN